MEQSLKTGRHKNVTFESSIIITIDSLKWLNERLPTKARMIEGLKNTNKN